MYSASIFVALFWYAASNLLFVSDIVRRCLLSQLDRFALAHCISLLIISGPDHSERNIKLIRISFGGQNNKVF